MGDKCELCFKRDQCRMLGKTKRMDEYCESFYPSDNVGMTKAEKAVSIALNRYHCPDRFKQE